MGLLAKIFGERKPVEGNKALVGMCRVVRGQISVYGLATTRKQVIKSMESDCDRVARKIAKECQKSGKGFSMDDIMASKLVQDALNTPEYMTMLKKLGMDESHIRVVVREAWLKARRGSRK